MAVLKWGKPEIEIAKLGGGGSLSWTKIDTPKIDTTQLETEEGDEKTAKEEGGAIVDSRKDSNNYTFSFELFAKKGSTKPIEDADGIITDNYAIRWTPEDPTTGGYQMLKCTVTVKETYSAADGGMWVYSFKGLKPDTGAILQAYNKG